MNMLMIFLLSVKSKVGVEIPDKTEVHSSITLVEPLQNSNFDLIETWPNDYLFKHFGQYLLWFARFGIVCTI